MGKIRILLVDDEIDTLESLKDVLEDHNFNVKTLQSGAETVEYVRRNIFDVILMDIKMPVMDGVLTYRKIKKICKENKTTVILITAYFLDDLIREAIHDGVYAILRKPINFNQLFRTIRQAKEGALVLIVEDVNAGSEGLRDILLDEGFMVKVVSSGEAAVEWAKKNTQDIILLDAHLPRMNGLETYLKLKQINPNPISIMMATDRQETAGIVDEALRQSAYTCLQKPLDPGSLVPMIKDLAKRKREGLPIVKPSVT